MKRENRKSIEANLRNKLSAQCKEKSDNLQKRLDCLDIDYLSLYKCKPHHETDLAKLTYYVMEMRKKHKK